MDNQFYQQMNFVPQNRRSQGMELASLILGLIAVSTCCCIYSALFCGSLSIMFALLSRGGERTLSSRAQIGLILGIVGIAATMLFYAYSFTMMLLQYGSLDSLLDATAVYSGYDSFEDMYESFMTIQ